MIEVIVVEMGAAIGVLRSIVIKLSKRGGGEDKYIYIHLRSLHVVPGQRSENEVVHTYLKQKRITRLVTRSKINLGRVETSRAEILIGSNGT